MPAAAMFSAPQKWLADLIARPVAGSGTFNARESFAHFDKDGSGSIDAVELHAALKHYGVELTEEGAREVLSLYDTNPDGRLDPEEFAEIARDVQRGLVVATTVDCSDEESAKRSWLGGMRKIRRRKPSNEDGGPSDEGGAGVCTILDDLPLDADLLYDRLEAGARLHYCSSFEPLMARVLKDEVELRGGNGPAKLAEWARNGQLHSAPEAEAEAEAEFSE